MNLRSRGRILSFALACVAPAIAHADTIEDFKATLTDGGLVNGTLTFGLVTIPNNQPSPAAPTISGYEITGDNFTVTSNGDTYTFLNSYAVGGTNNKPYSEFFFGSGGSFFVLGIPGNTPLASLPNGSICSANLPCTSVNYLGVTSATPVVSYLSAAADSSNVGSGTISSAPEPSSLVLLGTGLAGFYAAARRRLLCA